MTTSERRLAMALATGALTLVVCFLLAVAGVLYALGRIFRAFTYLRRAVRDARVSARAEGWGSAAAEREETTRQRAHTSTSDFH